MQKIESQRQIQESIQSTNKDEAPLQQKIVQEQIQDEDVPAEAPKSSFIE